MTTAGRRPGRTLTSGAILEAARELFSRTGYQGTTLRAVAERAGVNQALVRHFYGSKHQLFLAAVAFPPQPLIEMVAALQAAAPDQRGQRAATVFVSAWRDPATSQQLQAVFRAAAASDEGGMLVRRMVEDVIVPRVAGLLGVEVVRVGAAMSQLLGFAFLSAIVRAQPLAGLDDDQAIALLGPAVQAHLDGTWRLDFLRDSSVES